MLRFAIDFSFSETNLPPNHIRHVIFHEYSRGVTAAQAGRIINDIYGEGTTTDQTCQTNALIFITNALFFYLVNFVRITFAIFRAIFCQKIFFIIFLKMTL